METRRDALVLIAASAAAAASAQTPAEHIHSASSEAPAALPPPKVFTPEELKTIGKLMDVIIPRTDTPGASDVHAPLLLDYTAVRNPQVAELWRKHLSSIDPATWKPEETDPFFILLKNTTINLYYSTREGLTQELGWNANTYLPEFVGCTHPEHQV